MTGFSISVKEIQARHEERTRKRLTIYRNIAERCFKEIKKSADQEQSFCLFQIPDFRIGLPIYKKAQCYEYLEMKLNEKGFQCRQVPQTDLIYISWNLRKPNLKTIEYIPQTSPLMIEASATSEPSAPSTLRKPREIADFPTRRREIQFRDAPKNPIKYSPLLY